MSSKTGVVIVILILLLVLSLGYIGYIKYSGWQLGKQISIYQDGVKLGYEQAIIQIVQQASACQQVPLRVENQTTNIVSVNCLEKN